MGQQNGRSSRPLPPGRAPREPPPRPGCDPQGTGAAGTAQGTRRRRGAGGTQTFLREQPGESRTLPRPRHRAGSAPLPNKSRRWDGASAGKFRMPGAERARPEVTGGDKPWGRVTAATGAVPAGHPGGAGSGGERRSEKGNWGSEQGSLSRGLLLCWGCVGARAGCHQSWGHRWLLILVSLLWKRQRELNSGGMGQSWSAAGTPCLGRAGWKMLCNSPQKPRGIGKNQEKNDKSYRREES